MLYLQPVAARSFEIGFFDTTKTGEITSRLAADTATVADQVTTS